MATLRPVATASSLFAATFQACQVDTLHRAIPRCHSLVLDLLVHGGKVKVCGTCSRDDETDLRVVSLESLCGSVPLATGLLEPGVS